MNAEYMEYIRMRELNGNEMKEVNGGILPVAAAIVVVRVGQLAVKAAHKLAPAVAAAATAAGSFIAGALGYNLGKG